MKIILIAVLLVVATPILVLCQTNQNDKTAKELMQLEREWVTATLKRDKFWLERFFADEFISTHPTSGTIKWKQSRRQAKLIKQTKINCCGFWASVSDWQSLSAQ